MVKPTSLTELVLPLLAELKEDQLPFLVAHIERLLAAHYRRLAMTVSDAASSDLLEACADREIANADCIDGLLGNKGADVMDIQSKFPTLSTQLSELLETQSTEEQLRTLAEGEANGAAIYRDLANQINVGDTQNKLLACANAENENVRSIERVIEISGNEFR